MTLFKSLPMSRRNFMGGALAGAGLLALPGRAAHAAAGHGFTHGVASGDPLVDRVILWTRYMPEGAPAQKTLVQWEVATDEAFSHVVNRGEAKSGPEGDYTVKVDATGLMPGCHYYYRFAVGKATSPVGRTKTLSAKGASHARLAVISCSNYPQGFFNVYKELAARDVAMIVHLGDYIYEYGDGIYANDEILAQGRHVSKAEATVLEGYRARYALYRSDPDLQAAHASHPFVCVWDDHEIANNTWKGGAENHNEGEGDWAARRADAVRAYHEWLPIREGDRAPDHINRTFDIGGLASLIMLDTRLVGRDKQLDYATDLPMRTIPFDFSDKAHPKAVLDGTTLKTLPSAAVKHIPVPFKLGGEKPVPMTDYDQIKVLDPKKLPEGYSYIPDTETFAKDILGADNRTIMGADQEDWLAGELASSKAAGVPWQILGQQLIIGRVGIPMLKDEDIDWSKSKFVSRERFHMIRMLGSMGMPLNLDFWDGYPACRDRVYASVKEHANNAVFLSGDTHNAWCFELTDSSGDHVAVELATPSVSSPGMETYIPAPPARVEEEMKKSSPELVYFNSKDRGWMELDVAPETLTCSWHYVTTVHSPDYEAVAGPSYVTKAGSHRVSEI